MSPGAAQPPCPQYMERKEVPAVKKRIAALLCSLSLVCALVLPALGTSGSTVYLLAVGDKFYDAYRPVAVNGVIYVPYTIFDRSATGVDLGVYYGITPERGTILTLYSLSGMLTFTMQMGTCEDNLGNSMNFHALPRNGIPYVPAAAVCNFFGLQYSFLPTTDRGTLIRITNPTSPGGLSDGFFLQSAQGAMAYRYNQIIQSQTPQPTATPTPAPTPTPQPSASRPPNAGNNGDTRVYLALDASQAEGDWTALFPSGCYALFLFTPDSLAGQAALVRKAVAAGHSVGLLADPALDSQGVLEELERGNELLSHIARVRTRFYAFSEGPVLSQTDILAAEGWIRWQANWHTAPNPANAQGMLNGGPSLVRMDLSETLPTHIYRVVAALQSSGYDLRRPLETEL